jgi:hypothetical protein
MTKTIILIGPLLFAVVLGSGCSSRQTATIPEFGEAVNNVMQRQINDYEAAIHPEPNAIEGSDPYRLDAALKAYREDIAAPQDVQRPLTLSLGGAKGKQ